MKLSVLNVVMFSVGSILIYSGIKAYYPQDVIKWGLGGKEPESFATKSDGNVKPQVPPGEHPGDLGPWTPDDPDIPGEADIINA